MSAFIMTTTGDVTGPASSVDGDLAVFDGTSGKFIKSASRSLNRMPFCLGANGVSIAGVGGGNVVHLDLLVPANLFTKDGDHVRIVGECIFAANTNTKNFNSNFAGTILSMSGPYNASFMRNEWIVMRVNSTQFRLTNLSVRGVSGSAGTAETDRVSAVVTVDWGQSQTLRVSASGVATSDVTVVTSLATFFPVP